ncbi:MAG: tetratricopeptide repeat protein [Bacteroidales bacterium]|nr:tetratricopeptide repeat protein [Bacteroidales bacterium]
MKHFILLFIFFSFLFNTQANKEIDSLENLLYKSSGKEKIKILNSLSEKYLYFDIDKSISLAKQAIDLCEKTNDDEGWINAITNLGIANEYNGNYQEALIYYQKALKKSIIINNKSKTASCYVNIGIANKMTNNIDSAIYNYELAKTIYEETEDFRGLAFIYNNLGTVYNIKSNYPQALIAYKKSLALIEQIKDNNSKFSVLVNIGNTYYYMSQYNKASDYYFAALSESKKLKIKASEASSYNNIGLVYRAQKKYEKALEFFEKSGKIYTEIGDKYNLGISSQNLGLVNFDLKNYTKALENLNFSVQIRKELNDLSGLELTYNNIGITYYELGKYLESEKYYLMGLKNNLSTNDKNNKAIICINLGNLYTKIDKKQLSKAYLDTALAIAQEIQSPELIKETYKAFAEHFEGFGDFKSSVEFIKKFIKIEGEIINTENLNRISELEAIYELEQKELKINNLENLRAINELRIQKQESEIYRERNFNLILIISFVGFFAISLLVFFLIRLQNKRKRNQIEKKSLELETGMLRSQMNPHFIFNSMNSIQSYISENDAYRAEKYLSKFAMLIRNILENSRKSYISIEKELETLELYIGLEKLRFNNKFEYKIESDDNIDYEFFTIPPMLIQPYIENAIIHGIQNKDEMGLIIVNFKLLGNIIKCSVIDNGIGRSESAKIKKEKKHESLGIKVTEERLELLTKESGKQLNVKIIDLFENNNPCGTRVEIDIPFKEI